MSAPKNLIKVKNASAGEFVYKDTNAPFSGSYYELNSKLYEGDSFRFGTPELVITENANQLYNNSDTFIYSYISGITSQTLAEPIIIPVEDPGTSLFYYTQVNIQPAFVREIDEQTYLSLQGNPLYKTTFAGTYKGVLQTLDEADRQVPGVANLRLASSGDGRSDIVPLT
jgi:hypothetical protein